MATIGATVSLLISAFIVVNANRKCEIYTKVQECLAGELTDEQKTALEPVRLFKACMVEKLGGTPCDAERPRPNRETKMAAVKDCKDQVKAQFPEVDKAQTKQALKDICGIEFTRKPKPGSGSPPSGEQTEAPEPEGVDEEVPPETVNPEPESAAAAVPK